MLCRMYQIVVFETIRIYVSNAVTVGIKGFAMQIHAFTNRMWWFSCLLVIVVHYSETSLAVVLPEKNVLPTDFAGNTVKKIIEGLGLTYEQHNVTTEDGYILNLNRMMNPDRENDADKGIPVLFLHGLSMHSDSWLLLTKPEDNIPVAFLLAGYDVWLGDQRGTIRSRQHVFLSPDSESFWDFSFHETGVYDLPAFIDFVLKETGHEKLVYVGVSDGGADYYIMCTERPDYQKKLYGGILYEPVGESPSAKTKELAVLQKVRKLAEREVETGTAQFPPSIQRWKVKEYKACLSAPKQSMQRAELIWGRGCVYEPDNFCKKMIHSYGGTSAKSFLHNYQLFATPGVFRQYDHGIIGNLLRYGRLRPPVYDIKKLKLFTAIYYSDIDIFAPGRVVETFVEKFKGPKYLCQMKGVCHLFNFIDDRAGKFVPDAVDVLRSMTGSTNSTKIKSGTCGEIDF